MINLANKFQNYVMIILELMKMNVLDIVQIIQRKNAILLMKNVLNNIYIVQIIMEMIKVYVNQLYPIVKMVKIF